jgi:hypothetical protein
MHHQLIEYDDKNRARVTSFDASKRSGVPSAPTVELFGGSENQVKVTVSSREAGILSTPLVASEPR